MITAGFECECVSIAMEAFVSFGRRIMIMTVMTDHQSLGREQEKDCGSVLSFEDDIVKVE